jgi:hypothetical protein
LVRKASALIQNAAVTPMRYVYPLDPAECPVVAEFMETLFGDPTMAMRRMIARASSWVI